MLLPAVLFASVAIAQKKIPPPLPPASQPSNTSTKRLAPPPTPPFPNESYKSFLNRNPMVKSVGWLANGRMIRIHLKSGKEELYNLDSENELRTLNQKYGVPPTAPPPPPVER